MNRLVPLVLAALVAAGGVLAAVGPVAGRMSRPAATRHGGTSLVVPTGPAPTVDGRCTEYGAGDAQVTLQDPDGPAVFLRATAAALYVCFQDLPLTDNGTRQLPYVAVNVDPDHSGGATPAETDFRLRIDLDTPDAAYEVGDGAGGWSVATRAGWSAASVRRICGRALCADAELLVPAEFVESWDSEWGLLVAHHWVTVPGDDRPWPWQSPAGLPGVPNTWANVARAGFPTSTAAATSTDLPPATATPGVPVTESATPSDTPTEPATPTPTATATPSPTATPAVPATGTGPTPTATASATSVGGDTPTPGPTRTLGPTPTRTPSPTPTASPTASPTPTRPGTAVPPVMAGLLLDPAVAYTGGTVMAWGANFGCRSGGIALSWPDGTRLGWTLDEPFQLVLTLPASVPPATYEVTARCGDDSGGVARAAVRLQAPPPPPVADFDLPAATLYVGQILAVEDASTTGVTRRDWDFGDGSALDHRDATAHAYGAAGAYTVTLTVFDDAGRVDAARRVALVEEAVAAGRLDVGPDGRTVAFLDQSQGPFSGWRWEFGDGTSSQRRAVSHVYERPGTYMPRLVASYPGPGGRRVTRAAELGPLVVGSGAAYNLALVGLDVVQVNLADQVLAARRRTVARVHVRREGADDIATARYDLRLRAYRADGAQIAGAPFLRRLAAAPGAGAAREDVVELELPQEWLLARTAAVTDPHLGRVTVSEPVTISVDIRALNLREDNTDDNRLDRPVTFEPTAGLDLLLVAPAPGRADLAQVFGALLQTLPVAGGDLRPWLPLGALGLAGLPLEQEAGAGAALVAADQAFRSSEPLRLSPWGVMLAPDRAAAEADPCAAAFTVGGRGLWVAARGAAAVTVPSNPLTALVHGLAHQLGLWNAAGGRPADGPLDPAYPTADGTLDGDGYDVVDLSLRPRGAHHDYMSHAACPDGAPWWSAYSYGRLVRRLTPAGGVAGSGPARSGQQAAPGPWPAAAAAGPAQPPPLASDYAVLSGVIRPPEMGGERLVVEPIFHYDTRRDPSDDALGAGSWSITLLDGAGRTLFTRFLSVTYPEDGAGRPRPRAFFQVLPWHAFTRRVVIREADEVRWERSVPASWPLVAVTAPAADTAWEQGRTYQVRWQAEDPEGMALSYQVDLSPDDGVSWRPVGSTLSQQSVPLETAFLPGCFACRVRVRASNGLLMSEAESGPFRIAPPPPVVEIVAPVEGAQVVASEPVWLQGVAYDYTDGPLGPGQVTWTSDLDGHLGLDPSLQTQLSVGRHVLQLSALNSHGQRGIAAITLQVLPGRRDHTVFVPWAGQP